MSTRYEDALASLGRAPLEQFVLVRKQLVAELKASGDKEGATRLAKVARPTLSVWTTNQLWWRANGAFQALFQLAVRLRAGDRSAAAAHHAQLATLRVEASAILRESGHAAAETTLRRIGINLAALAARGSFDPDPPGALAFDREPPGFESMELAAALGPNVHRVDHARARRAGHDGVATSPERAEQERDKPSVQARRRGRKAEGGQSAEQERRRQQEEAQRRAEQERRRQQEEAQRRAAEERERKQALRRALEAELSAAKRAVAPHARRVERLRAALSAADAELAQAHALVAELEARLAALHT